MAAHPRPAARTPLTVALGCLIAALALPAAAGAGLPKTKNTSIVPGTSMGGVKLDMKRSKVLAKWGAGKCSGDLCTWEGKGTPGHTERAVVSFVKGRVYLISLNASFVGNDLKFKAGPLAK